LESYSLFQLNEYIRRVIALNFREPLWIEAEIAQAKDSRGNYYIDLIEKDEDGEGVVAQISAAIWYRNFQFIKKKIGDIVYDLLEEGSQVRLKCRIDFHERYGIKLIIEDIDPNYTFGKLELKRQQIINRLEEEGLMELNKSLLVPTVIQRIAVISSANAAGYQDFKNQLINNGYDYGFKIDLYDGAVQGAKGEQDTKQAIEDICSKKEYYDIVAIIRGGGSKLDLSGYDNYEIAKDIALSEIPFIIGIGHDIDSTVADLVSCLSLKTPTAVADYIIDRNMTFEARIEQSMGQLQRAAHHTLRQHELSLKSLSEKMRIGIQYLLNEELGQLQLLQSHLSSGVKARLTDAFHQLEKMGLSLDVRDPSNIMSQGYSYVTRQGQAIRSVKKLKKNDEVEIHLIDGSTHSKIL